MNKSTEFSHDYIEALPLSAEQKAALPTSDLQAVHEALDAQHHPFERADDSPLASVKARLEASWPGSLGGETADYR
ncbi:Glucans biosynthesis glucosyltransferase H [Cedecea neteri]|uniref:Glucans biosynthesis glucosyltransferase H n=1 Tax=Cedecea neteri TaxID=158822 RepID=A0A2X3L2C9_9ENTR|nr:Glucans biosynthesis glucosyltransferase H [Cedecea neteri]